MSIDIADQRGGKRTRWLESSTSEQVLARTVANVIGSESRSTEAICRILEGLAVSIADTRPNTSLLSDSGRLIAELRRSFPELGCVRVAVPFPETETDLSANFFSTLAYELSSHSSNPADHGVVGTPASLATDMVALAAALWLGMYTNFMFWYRSTGASPNAAW